MRSVLLSRSVISSALACCGAIASYYLVPWPIGGVLWAWLCYLTWRPLQDRE